MSFRLQKCCTVTHASTHLSRALLSHALAYRPPSTASFVEMYLDVEHPSGGVQQQEENPHLRVRNAAGAPASEVGKTKPPALFRVWLDLVTALPPQGNKAGEESEEGTNIDESKESKDTAAMFVQTPALSQIRTALIDAAKSIVRCTRGHQRSITRNERQRAGRYHTVMAREDLGSFGAVAEGANLMPLQGELRGALMEDVVTRNALVRIEAVVAANRGPMDAVLELFRPYAGLFHHSEDSAAMDLVAVGTDPPSLGHIKAAISRFDHVRRDVHVLCDDIVVIPGCLVEVRTRRLKDAIIARAVDLQRQMLQCLARFTVERCNALTALYTTTVAELAIAPTTSVEMNDLAAYAKAAVAEIPIRAARFGGHNGVHEYVIVLTVNNFRWDSMKGSRQAVLQCMAGPHMCQAAYSKCRMTLDVVRNKLDEAAAVEMKALVTGMRQLAVAVDKVRQSTARGSPNREKRIAGFRKVLRGLVAGAAKLFDEEQRLGKQPTNVNTKLRQLEAEVDAVAGTKLEREPGRS